MNNYSKLYIGVVGVILVAAGAVGGWLVARDGTPTALSAAAPINSYPLTPTQFNDSRPLSAVVGSTAGQPVVVRAAGTITRLACEPGAVWASGDTPISINDSAVLAIHSITPPWRDLKVAASGPDVDATLEAFQDLGVKVPDTGPLSTASLEAISKYLRSKDVAVADPTVLMRTALMWLSGPSLVIKDCSSSLGQEVAAGASVATPKDVVVSLTIDPMPPDLAPGQRKIEIGQLSLTATSDGSITGAEELAAIQGDVTAEALLENAAARKQPVSVIYALAQPIEAYSIPAAALIGDDGATCIQARGVLVDVAVVSSSLGSTLIQFPDGVQPPSAIDLGQGLPQSCV